MSKLELKSVSITPNPANTRELLTVTIEVEDAEIIYGTDYKYARSSGNEEIYAGEDGMI